MKRIKATKTALYVLVREAMEKYEPRAVVPACRETTFNKVPGEPSYSMHFEAGNETWYYCLLSACGGKPLLKINRHERTPDKWAYNTLDMAFEDLEARGLAEEFEPKRRERKGA